MIWLAWRQFRSQAAVVFGGLAVLAVVVIVTGLQLRHWYGTSGISSCPKVGDCGTVTSAFTQHYSWLQTLLGSVLMQWLPAVIGVFWGAPLIAREFDSGTFRLVWTQSITRVHWLAAKIAVVGTASVAASALLSWMVTWWSTPLDGIADTKFDPSIFSQRDIAPIGYAAFAFALGLTAGLLIRRTLPAMATTLVGYIAARLVVLIWIRPHFAAPLHATVTLQPPGASGEPVRLPGGSLAGPGAWVMSSKITDSSGHVVGGIAVPPGDSCVTTNTCLAGYHQTVTYQPGNRYWPFQWYETGLFTGVAIILIGFCFWWLTGHRLRPARRATAGARATDVPASAPAAVR